MDSLIPVINSLQDIFAGLGFEPVTLPQIAVVGGQSAGKSSVMENIVGKDFLPRGSGIVTRRPLVIQLINPHKPQWNEKTDSDTGKVYYEHATTGERSEVKPKEDKADASFQDYGEFGHKPGERMTNFEDVRKEIVDITDKECPGKNISSKPITLKIVSKDVLNLTLVDLPGMTKVAVGDQPSDIGKQIYEMVSKYVQNENVIVLAVSPANTDLANSDALLLAREVDPEGLRTVGVITKLDLMDQGTDACEVLENKLYPLRLGYVGVVNRSQKDINDSKDIKAALAAERRYFERTPVYMHLAHRMGTEYLAKQLNKLLVQHIKDKLPAIRAKILAMTHQKESELAALGGDDLGESDRKYMLLQALNKAAGDFKSALDGSSRDMSTEELYGGARIRYIFKSVYTSAMDEALGLNNPDALNKEIQTTMVNVQGTKPGFFLSDRCFEILVQRQLERMVKPSMSCAQLVFDELTRVVPDLKTAELERYDVLREHVTGVTAKMLRSRLDETRDFIKKLLDMELAYINTEHPDFIKSGALDILYGEDRKADGAAAGAAGTNAPVKGPSQAQRAYRRAKLAEVFKYLDKNKDGSIDETEIKAWGKDLTGQEYTTETVERMLACFDEDKDRKISQKEWLDKHDKLIPGDYSDEQFEKALEKYLPKRTLDQIMQRLPVSLKADSDKSGREAHQVNVIRQLLLQYVGIVQKNVLDAVPKATMLLLVNFVHDKIQDQLLKELYKEEMVDELLQESADIAVQRKRCREMVRVLQRALEVLNAVNDSSY